MSSLKYIEDQIRELSALLKGALTGHVDFDKSNPQYEKIRRKIIAMTPLIGPPPKFLSSCETLWAIWSIYVKGKMPTYSLRRDWLQENFDKYYENAKAGWVSLPFDQELVHKDILIGEQIGSGGFSVVYLCEHLVLGGNRVIKKLDPLFADEEAEIKAIRRFAREISILSRLNHPNIVKIFDAGIAGGNPYIVMEHIAGKDLQKSVEANGVFSQDEGVAITKQTVKALDAAHTSSVIHRDIKPRNAMWDGTHLTLLDFGAGQWVEKILSTRMTTQPVGTVGYYAPELIEDPTLLNPSVDCYSTGIMFHYLLTGRLPTPGNPEYFLAEKNIRRDIIDWILKAVSPKETRFQNGQEMLQEISALG